MTIANLLYISILSDIILVSDVNDHLLSSLWCSFPTCWRILKSFSILGECTKKSDYVKCVVCQDAVLATDTEHKSESHCRELTPGISKCSLCHENIYLPADGGWERHFSIGCPRQKRKLANQ